MKTILKAYNILLFVTCMAVSSQVLATGEPMVEKKKTYTKSYPVSAGDKASFNNQFGELKLNTWDKNEVKVDITITTEAGTDEKAQRIMDRISIEDGKNNNGVFFKTKIQSNDKQDRWEKGEKQKFSIDYVVYMPARNPLLVENQFGSMNLGDYSGEITVISKFGSLTAGKLSNNKKINVEFGKAEIGGISNGEVVIKFSKVSIGSLDGSVKAEFEYCDGAMLKVDNDVKSLQVKNNFSHLYINVSTNLSASFDISTHFGDLNNKTSFSIKEEGDDDNRRGPDFTRKFSGKTGGGTIPIQIKSDFGGVTIGHNLNININIDKDEDKKEKKRTTRI